MTTGLRCPVRDEVVTECAGTLAVGEPIETASRRVDDHAAPLVDDFDFAIGFLPPPKAVMAGVCGCWPHLAFGLLKGTSMSVCTAGREITPP